MAELHLAVLIRDHEKKQEELRNSKHTGLVMKLKEFTKPTAIKPISILFLLFFVQQFSGIYITLFYAIDFFKVRLHKLSREISIVIIGSVANGKRYESVFSIDSPRYCTFLYVDG